MRLIDTEKVVETDIISFETFTEVKKPEYAILSHTWEKHQEHEVSFADCGNKSRNAKKKKGYKKIKKACELARRQLPPAKYLWVDTCCIDKSSSAELTEAINSMFKWYKGAKFCIVWLSDLESPQGPEPVDELTLRKCRWFRRGWTLQELIAPTTVYFYSKKWNLIGSKQQLSAQISAVTGIETDVLDQRVPLSAILVAKRMSWAANRKTTREEDTAYCLLGVFDLNIPIIYGEGNKAFKRLQEEILRSSYDLSIFAWTPVNDDRSRMYCGFLADSPDAFSRCSKLVPVDMFWEVRGELVSMSTSLRLKVPHYHMRYHRKCQYFLRLNCRHANDDKERCLAVPIRKIEPSTYLRARLLPVTTESTAFGLKTCPLEDFGYQTTVLLTSLPDSLGHRPLRWDPSRDITALTRFAAVQFETTHPGFLSWDGNYPHGFPRQFWDVQDQMFFSPRGSTSNWGAISLVEDGVTLAIFLCAWYKEGNRWDCKGTLIGCDDSPDWMNLWRDLFITAPEFDHRMSFVLHQLRYNYEVKMDQSSTKIRRQNGGTSEVFFTIEKSNGRGLCEEHFWKVTLGIK